MSFRRFRKWATTKATAAVVAAAPRLPGGAFDAVERLMALLGPHTPVLGRLVARNMRAAGAYSPAAVRAYFRQAARHLANAARMLHYNDPARTAALANEQIGIDVSIAHLRDTLRAGRGTIVAAPHVCNYVLTLVRLHRETPLTVYLRWSKDERKRRLKEAWCAAAGLRVILEPASASDPTSRAAACVDILRAGGALVMTPDIAQKRGRGVGVRLFGREAFLPAGPASIAMLAEAPLVPVFGRMEEGRHLITFGSPIFVEAHSRSGGGETAKPRGEDAPRSIAPRRSKGVRAAALAAAMQAWADQFEQWVRAEPAAWFLWADSRWSRVLANDPKYAGE